MLSALNAGYKGQPDALASIGNDNRLKIWDIVSGSMRQHFAEPSHLSAEYTCVAFSARKKVSL